MFENNNYVSPHFITHIFRHIKAEEMTKNNVPKDQINLMGGWDKDVASVHY